MNFLFCMWVIDNVVYHGDLGFFLSETACGLCSEMDSEKGKLFIGGISWETTEDRLKDYFKRFGEVVEAVIMKDRTTRRARGFGFVVFADPAIADRVVLDKHTIDGRTVSCPSPVQ